MPVVYRLHGQIREAVEQDPYMKWPIHVFYGEPEKIRTYVAERREYLKKELHRL